MPQLRAWLCSRSAPDLKISDKHSKSSFRCTSSMNTLSIGVITFSTVMSPKSKALERACGGLSPRQTHTFQTRAHLRFHDSVFEVIHAFPLVVDVEQLPELQQVQRQEGEGVWREQEKFNRVDVPRTSFLL